ncbi:hypothetical protein [Micromonospora sp. NPDC005206]|uniref:hypothetical protein n=1 Tax=Micromonospora sp. NPDC005206 TaxID=3157022 RepID=UPI0033A2EDDF
MTKWVTTGTTEAGRPWTLTDRWGSSALRLAQLLAARSFFRTEEVVIRDNASVRHRGSSLAFWSLVLAETFGEDATEDRLVSDTDHKRAISNLCRLLREFLGQQASTVDQR